MPASQLVGLLHALALHRARPSVTAIRAVLAMTIAIAVCNTNQYSFFKNSKKSFFPYLAVRTRVAGRHHGRGCQYWFSVRVHVTPYRTWIELM